MAGLAHVIMALVQVYIYLILVARYFCSVFGAGLFLLIRLLCDREVKRTFGNVPTSHRIVSGYQLVGPANYRHHCRVHQVPVILVLYRSPRVFSFQYLRTSHSKL